MSPGHDRRRSLAQRLASSLRWLVGAGVFCGLLALAAWQAQADGITKTWAIAEFGEPLYKDGIEHWPYANPEAPKGGKIVLGAGRQTFDSLNPYIRRGIPPLGLLGLESDSLMMGSGDEIEARYGLLAESVEYPEDISWAIFTLRPEARYSDGHPITAEDFVFAYERLLNLEHGRPFIREYYSRIESVEVLDPRRLKVNFATKNKMKSVIIASGFSPSPKHWYEGSDCDPYTTYLEPEPSSGPYIISKVDVGRSLTFSRDPDYWGKDLNVRKGLYNFDEIRFEFYRDDSVLFEAFKAGKIDFRRENRAQRWVQGYDFPALADGRVIRRTIAPELIASTRTTMDPGSAYLSGVRGMFMNQRRPPFDDRRVRQALVHLYDFEAIQRTVLSGQYQRVRSTFPGSEYAHQGRPEGLELELLEPFRDQLPKEVFEEAFNPPKTDGSGRNRGNRRIALALLKAAGFEARDGKIVNVESGEPLRFGIMIAAPSLQRVIQPYVTTLRKMGIEARIELVEAAQRERRHDEFDYDLTVVAYTFYPPPAELVLNRFHSSTADVKASANMAGIKDPVVDALLDRMITADGKEELLATARALDRVLMWSYYLIPEYYGDEAWLAYWDRFGYPERKAKYGIGFQSTWWIDAEKDAALDR